jgi:hypothetical protein
MHKYNIGDILCDKDERVGFSTRYFLVVEINDPWYTLLNINTSSVGEFYIKVVDGHSTVSKAA